MAEPRRRGRGQHCEQAARRKPPRPVAEHARWERVVRDDQPRGFGRIVELPSQIAASVR
jgi:hypothetical protein